MKYGERIAESESGIPIEHSRVFRKVAQNTNTVVACRAVGVYATQLIREGYATKGYHVKAKSCDWGPMAGFVLADPALGKKGTSPDAKSWQQKRINDALNCGSQVIPLVISEQRRLSLTNLMMRTFQYYKTIPIPNNTQPTHVNVWARQKLNATMHGFILIKISELKEQYKPAGATQADWIICYEKNSKLIGKHGNSSCKKVVTTNSDEYFQLCALSNPRGIIAGAPANYKAAQTGDYDLWGVFPKILKRSRAEAKLHMSIVKAATEHDTTGQKKSFWQRDVINSHKYVKTFEDYSQQEGEHTGNLSLLIEEIAVRVNAGCRKRNEGGWLIHHSDEAGRPMIDELDAEAVVYFPNGNIWVMSTEDDVRSLRSELIKLRYKPLFNPGWEYKLNIRRDDIMREWRINNNRRAFPMQAG